MIEITDICKIKDYIVKWIVDWFDNNGKDCNAIIGISGGKDSSVVAALCVEALGKDRVIGVLMPNGHQSDIEDAYKLVNFLGINAMEVNIGQAYINLINSIELAMTEKGFDDIKVSEQTIINLPPRIRMSTLYAVAQSVNGRVACTDNCSESYIGYSTRWGDNIGDFAPLARFLSDEVVALGDVLGLPHELTHKTPSDGLCGKTDEDSFGFTYETLNNYIRNNGEIDDGEAKTKIEEKHERSRFKRLGLTIPSPSRIEFVKNDILCYNINI